MREYYAAPMEGLTGWRWRQVQAALFGGADRYYTPFLSPNANFEFQTKELREIDPENNRGMYAVPQILTRNADDFLRTASQLAGLGYREINLNLGCPSKTVVTKGCGAGFLERPDELECFLDHIFTNTDLKISIKTRLGMDNADEFEHLLEIYNRFPLEELIVHPRVQKDFYKNVPNLAAFELAVQKSKNPLCYNGDIFSVSDFAKIQERFPSVDCFMMGRGVLAMPSLAREIRGGKPADKNEIRKFHDIVYHTYCQEVSGDRNVLFKMKELWFYLAPMFADSKKYVKKIKKSEKCAVYECAVNELFANCPFNITSVQ